MSDTKNDVDVKDREPFTLDNCPPLFGEDVLAEILGMSVAWVQKSRYQGTGPKFKKLNGAVKYTREDARAYVAANTYISTSQAEPVVC